MYSKKAVNRKIQMIRVIEFVIKKLFIIIVSFQDHIFEKELWCGSTYFLIIF